jgi:hypothetical protein
MVTSPCFANPQKTKIRSRIGAFLFNSDLIRSGCEVSYFAIRAIRKTKQRLQRVRPSAAASKPSPDHGPRAHAPALGG